MYCASTHHIQNICLFSQIIGTIIGLKVKFAHISSSHVDGSAKPGGGTVLMKNFSKGVDNITYLKVIHSLCNVSNRGGGYLNLC